MSVITLDKIENELRLVQARLILAENGVETFALSPAEVILSSKFCCSRIARLPRSSAKPTSMMKQLTYFWRLTFRSRDQ